jgi:hypothetical protein
MASFNLNSLMSQAQSVAPAVLPMVAGPISPDILRNFLRGQPAYNDNRERAAVVLDTGFKAYDTYAAARPFLFWGSLATAAFSGYALWKRKKKGAEAVTMWTTLMLGSVVTAYVTRPPAKPAPPAPGQPAPPAGGVVAMLDGMRAKRRAADPQWADKVYQRLADTPGVREQMDSLPILKAAIL